MKGTKIAIQGVGSVGFLLAKNLAEQLVAQYVDPELVTQVECVI